MSPHPVYTIDPATPLMVDILGRAELVGWRFLVNDRGGVFGALDLAFRPGDRAAGGACFTRGPSGLATLPALARARRMGETAGRRMEVRLLRVPALYETVMWLHSAGMCEDVLLPIEPFAHFASGGEVADAALVSLLESPLAFCQRMQWIRTRTAQTPTNPSRRAYTHGGGSRPYRGGGG